MRVKTLREFLNAEDDDDEILVRVSVPEIEVEDVVLDIAGLRREMDPDTGDSILVLDCLTG